ncbi:MAG: leishmanolysin-related zinc metalloendopeptidase [Trueperaceae bacterium]
MHNVTISIALIILVSCVACSGSTGAKKPLELTLLSPTAEAVVSNAVVKVTGEVTREDVQISYSLNGDVERTIPLTEKTFNIAVTVPNGQNSITVRATHEDDVLEQTVRFIFAPQVTPTTALRNAGRLESNDAEFMRPSIGKGLTDLGDKQGLVFYDTFVFSVATLGVYTIESTQDYDGYSLLYKDTFIKETPEQNLLGSSDGASSIDEAAKVTASSTLTVQLEPNTVYVLVTTAFAGQTPKEYALGSYENIIKESESEAPPPTPFQLPPPNPTAFDITVRFVDNTLTLEQQEVFNSAAKTWSSVIREDVQDIPNFKLPADYFGGIIGTLDDVVIDVFGFSEDSNVLAFAGPTVLRDDTTANHFIPAYGYMGINLENFNIGGEPNGLTSLEDTVVHEMGHVLGIGTLWELTATAEGIQESPPPVDLGAVNPNYDPRFIGPKAVAVYQDFLRAAGRETETSIPIENSGNAGSINGHWRERVFGNEILSSSTDGNDEILSLLTAASLEDIGYTINQASTAIESYSLPTSNTTMLQRSSTEHSIAEREVLLAPLGTVGATGNIKLNSGAPVIELQGELERTFRKKTGRTLRLGERQ